MLICSAYRQTEKLKEDEMCSCTQLSINLFSILSVMNSVENGSIVCDVKRIATLEKRRNDATFHCQGIQLSHKHLLKGNVTG